MFFRAYKIKEFYFKFRIAEKCIGKNEKKPVDSELKIEKLLVKVFILLVQSKRVNNFH